MKKLIFTLVLFISPIFSQEKQIEVVADKSFAGKVKLNFVKTWGGEKATDENQFFANPVDLQVDKNGNLFILDASNQRVQSFDKNGKFVKSIGRKGKGPGEFVFPMNIFLNNEKLIVVDMGFASNIYNINTGKFESTDRQKNGEQVANYLPNGEVIKEKNLYNVKQLKPFTKWNDDKEILKFGKIRGEKESNYNRGLMNTWETTVDLKNNFFVAFCFLPGEVIKYKSDGKVEVVYKIKKPHFAKEFGFDQKNRDFIGTKMITSVAVDENENIFLILPKREKTKEELLIGATASGSFTEGGEISAKIVDPKINTYKTDLYQLLVFNREGKILLQKDLDYYFTKIKIFGNRLFLMDSYVEGKIDEFKVEY